MLAVNTDTQDLGIDPVKPVESDLVRRDLAASYGGECQWEKSDRHVLLAAKITQADLLAILILQREVRSKVTYSQCHG